LLGLVSEKLLYEGDVTGTLRSKLNYQYDEGGSLQGNDAPVQHDNANYTAAFVTGRANLSSVKRYDVTNQSQFTTTSSKYNTAGAVVSAKDALNHDVTISYTDAFAAAGTTLDPARGFLTLAYPTTITDPDGYSSSSRYHYDFGAPTWKQTPLPNVTTNTPGPEQKITYDSIGRLERITNLVNNAYTRFVYATSLTRLDSYATIQENAGEAHSFTISDGHGRVFATAMRRPETTNQFNGQLTLYDAMGRARLSSNPTETYASGLPMDWQIAGADDSAWHYTEQFFDWKGRVKKTVYPDGKYKEVTYDGCGCAGGEVITLTDEGTIVGGVAKRRQQKIYSDPLGRTVKTEVLNWEGGTPYSTTVNTYNARDQITQIRQWSGAEATGTFQDTIISFDGFGRLKTSRDPEQDAGTVTTFNYNSDDTVLSKVDARGVTSSYAYNGRRQIIGITYNLPTGSTIPMTSAVSYSYDAAANRTSMTDGLGVVTYQYDQLSRLLSESRTFSDPTNTAINGVSRMLSYTYNLAGALTSLTDPFGAQINYNFDAVGRVTSVTGSGFGGVSTYASNIQYRAWGGQKSVSYGDNKSATTGYDSRLRPASYDMVGLREQFEYYDDGRLKQLTDLDDRNQDVGYPDTARHFSRAYSFDQAGRMSAASGAPGATSNFPLNQIYAYDAFNNMTSRWGSYYYQMPSSDIGTFVNNRRQNWMYFADGQVKHTPLTYDSNLNETSFRDWRYDAAGRMIEVKETVTNPGSVSTYTTTYDGDGQAVREYLLENPTVSNSYLVRSSVLGEIVTRLNNAGNKVKTIVNVDGFLTATQDTSSGFSVVSWSHADPLGMSEAGDTKPVYDPLGNYIPWQHVPSGAPPNAYPPFSPNFGGLGGAFGTSQSVACTDAGSPINCTTAMRSVNNGSATIGSIISSQNPMNFFAGLGMVLVPDVSTSRIRTSSPKPGRPRVPPRLWPAGTRQRTADPGPGGDKEGGPGPIYTEVTTISYRLVSLTTPQNPTPTQQGGPCDQTIRDIFADSDAQAAANGFEPTGFPATDAWRNGQNRSQAGGPQPNQWGHLNGYSGHIYGSSPGTSDTTLYVPGNFSSYTPPSGNDAAATFYYRQLGNQRNVTLAVFHVGNFGIQRNNTNDAGSVRIGTSGGLGGETVGYRHSHLEVHAGRGLPATMRARNRTRQFFSRVFCP
jgi:YD repeat-containing protein